MKKTFTSIILCLSLFTSYAQVSYYKGEWTKINSEANFTGLLKLEIKDTVVTGEIIWTYRAIDSNDVTLVRYYKGQKGKSGIEYVNGVYSAGTFDIHFQGISKADPDLIIGMDKYLLKLSLDKGTIYGRTLSDGQNNGLVYFTKLNFTASEKEFKILKAKILSKVSDNAFVQ